MSLTIQLDGLDPAASPYARFSWTKAAVQWADEVGPVVREALKHEAPVAKTSLDGRKGGRLRDSIRYEREVAGGGLSAVFTANVPYARYVLDGTGPHVIAARAARALQFEFEGAVMYRARVNHPGTKPNNFPERAIGPLTVMLRDTFAEAVRVSAEGL